MKRVLIGAVLALVVLAVTFTIVRTTDDGAPVAGLQSSADPFGDNPVLPAGASRAVYSPDGARLAVVADGLLHVSDGEVTRITERGTRVVDAAWFPAGTAVIVAEGPAQTGQLSVLGRDGAEQGDVRLDPSVGFGTGHGMALTSNERAVVTAVERPELGATGVRSLAAVNLRTGVVRQLPAADGEEEFDPHRVDATRVAYTARRADGSTVPRLLDLGTGDRRRAGPVGTRALAVIGDGSLIALLDGRDIVAVPVDSPDATPQRLGTVAEGSGVVAVHPAGTQAVVTAATVEAEGSQVTRLRRLSLRPPRIRPDTGTPG